MALRAYRTSGLDGGSGALAGGFLSVRAGAAAGLGPARAGGCFLRSRHPAAGLPRRRLDRDEHPARHPLAGRGAGVGREPVIRLVHRSAGPDSDQALVERARGGDRGAFDELYRRHADLVWSRLGRLLGPDPEREDLLQQIFFEVFRDLWRFRGEAAFRTFLYRVVVNIACRSPEAPVAPPPAGVGGRSGRPDRRRAFPRGAGGRAPAPGAHAVAARYASSRRSASPSCCGWWRGCRWKRSRRSSRPDRRPSPSACATPTASWTACWRSMSSKEGAP